MKFNISIKNFGKINEAKIKIAPFTVIAGANSSGKSFVTKALYSFFNTINKDHVTYEAVQAVSRINAVFLQARYNINNPSTSIIVKMNNFADEIKKLADTIKKEYGETTYIEQISRSFIIKQQLTCLEETLGELRGDIFEIKKYQDLDKSLSLIARIIKAVDNIVSKPEHVLSGQIEDGFKNAIKENFQVQSLVELKNYKTKDDDVISFNFDQLGSIIINNEQISFTLQGSSIDEFQRLYNVVFIESPVYWKIKRSLEKVREQKSYSRIINKQSSLLGVPEYFYDLMELLDDKVKLDRHASDSEDIISYINDAINGELNINETGEIFYKEKNSNKNTGLSTVATGITSLGLISLLLKKNVIAKGSFLFFDEPEVNLHPAWQQVMVEALYKLSENGINIVIASHSIDMMKYVENIMSKASKNKLDEHFAVNQLSSDGNSIGDDSPLLKKMAAIKVDLNKPFFNMHIESMW